MSTSSYHHGDLRQALIDAAVVAVREQGHDGWSLRDLGRRVGVSHNAAYRHFAHRDDLVAAVSELTMHRLVDALTARISAVRATEPVLRARCRLAETGRGYVDFALGEPALFRLAFMSYGLMQASPEPARDPYVLLGSVLDELVDVGFLATTARPGAEVTCWSAVHGFSVLATEGQLRTLPAAVREERLEQVLTAIDRSYAATTGSPWGPDDLRRDPAS